MKVRYNTVYFIVQWNLCVFWSILLIIIWIQNYLPIYLLILYGLIILAYIMEVLYIQQKGYLILKEEHLIKVSLYRPKKIDLNNLKRVYSTPFYVAISDTKQNLKVKKKWISPRDYRLLETKLKTRFHLGVS